MHRRPPGTLLIAGFALAACVLHGRAGDGPGASCAPGVTTVGPADSALLEAAATMVRIGPALDSVWPGYAFDRRPFILAVPGETVLAVTTPAEPPRDPFIPACGPALPRELRGRAYVHRGVLPDLKASDGLVDIEFPLGDRTATAVPLRPGVIATVELLAHEAFHAYQNRAFPPASRNEAAAPEVYADPEYGRLAAIERRMLASALAHQATHQPADSLERLLRAYLAVRHRRTARLPRIVVLTERELEAVEGTAQLVGTFAGALATARTTAQVAGTFGEGNATARPVARVDDRIRVLLSKPLDESLAPNWRHRARLYGTGAALALLLEERGVDWRDGLRRGGWLDELLARSVAFQPSRDRALVAWALQRFDPQN